MKTKIKNKIEKHNCFNNHFNLPLILILSIKDILKWNLDSNKIEQQVEETPKTNPYCDYINMNLINVDFNELKKINSNTKGWIQVNGLI